MHINQRRKRRESESWTVEREEEEEEEEKKKEKKKHKHADENHQQSRSYDADTQALLNTLSLVALTFEPRPTPIKHLKAFMFPLPQINNIQHPPPPPPPPPHKPRKAPSFPPPPLTPTPTPPPPPPRLWLGQIFDLGEEALDHLATFISTGGEMNLAEVTGDKTHRLLLTGPALNRSTTTKTVCVAVPTQMAVFFSIKIQK